MLVNVVNKMNGQTFEMSDWLFKSIFMRRDKPSKVNPSIEMCLCGLLASLFNGLNPNLNL